MTAQTEIRRPADAVWAAIGDFCDLRWNPAVAELRCAGKLRTVITRSGDVEIDELEFDRDEAQRTYSYGVVAIRGDPQVTVGGGQEFDLGPLVGHHRATISATPTGAVSCLVTYSAEIEGGFDSTIATIVGGYQHRIDALKARLEQELPDGD